MSVEFRTAIPKSISVWNTKLTASDLNLDICEKNARQCDADNLDGYLVTLKEVVGQLNNIKDVFTSHGKHYADCGLHVGCVKATNPNTYGNGSKPVYNVVANSAPAHLENLTVIVEEPAYATHWEWENGAEVRYNLLVDWSNDPYWAEEGRGTWKRCRLSAYPGVDRCAINYLPSLFMHELGHTMGLYHLYPGSLMMDAHEVTGPQIWDIIQLGYRYDDHTPAAR